MPAAQTDAGPAEIAEPPRRAWWMARRVLAAGIGIVLLAAGATYALAISEVSKVVEALGETKALHVAPSLLKPAGKGEAQTLLLVGNDERPPPKSNPYGAVLKHSNEMLLVRIDPSKPTISMLSIPRELRATFTAPNGEVITNRINSAYTYGGVNLMLKTIKNMFGLSVNHVFIVSFPKFRRAVDEVGCVYMTVDRRYYHVNEPGGEQYFEINLQPGYQRLCGREALEYVANRHEDTSLDRDARDQRFLLEVKAQYGPTLLESREKFEHILGRAIETDLHGQSAVLNLLELLVEAEGKPVRQTPFHVTFGRSEDTASPQQIGEAVHSFLTGTAPISRRGVDAAVRAARAGARHHAAAGGASLVATTGEELATARAAAPQLPFPLEYPTVREATAASEPDTLHLYTMHDEQGRPHPAYVISIDQGELGQYYDVQGTTWEDPPILSDPSQTVKIGPRTYSLFYSGELIRTISWREQGGVFWIENTLSNAVQPREMLAMAEETVPVIDASPGIASAAGAAGSGVRGIAVPPRSASSESAFSSVVIPLVSLLMLLAIAGLAGVLIIRQRDLMRLREQVAHAIAVEAAQRSHVGSDPHGPLIARRSARITDPPEPASGAAPVGEEGVIIYD